MQDDHYSLDRFEGDFAVLYCGTEKRDVPRRELPAAVQEGALLRETPDGWQLLDEQTAQRRQLLARQRRKRMGGHS